MENDKTGLKPEEQVDKMSMKPEEYLEQRIDGQLKWYGGKSATNKRNFYLCRTLIIVSGASIPVLVGYSDNQGFEWLRYLVGALGGVVAISEGILSLKKYKENWSIYRYTCEALEREKLLFMNGIDIYAGDKKTAFKTFVKNAENIMASENNDWKEQLANQGKQ